jgi:hypothetical protein
MATPAGTFFVLTVQIQIQQQPPRKATVYLSEHHCHPWIADE